MKRKNLSTKQNSENNMQILNHKKLQQQKQTKRFVDTALCQSDSEESLIETNTNHSVVNRNKNQKNRDFHIFSASKNLNDNVDSSPRKRKNSTSNFEKIDVKKKLFDFKIIENENENSDVNRNIQKAKSKDPFNYIEFEQYPCDHSAIKQLDFDLKIGFKVQTPEKLYRNSNNGIVSSNVFSANNHLLQDQLKLEENKSKRRTGIIFSEYSSLFLY